MVKTTFPLTREQEGLWVEWKLSARGMSYNTCVQAKICGDLDVPRFRQAIADVVANFELLRGYCVEENGHPVMQLSDEPFEIDVLDVSEGAAEETEAARSRALAVLNRKRDAAIDLTTFPLIRAGVIKVATDIYYFIGVVPHLISDGYSAVFILHAISIAYNQGGQGLIDAFAEDKKDWTDYLTVRAERDPELREKAIAHWQDVLSDAKHITPICPKEAEVFDTNGKRSYFSIDEVVAKQMRKLAFAQRTSLFSVLAALYATFLYRHTDQDDMIIAFPVNLRPPGFRNAFGFFVNVVPMRIDLSGNPTFNELIKRVGQARRQDKKHQHLPSLDIVKAKRAVQQDFDGRLTNVSMGQTVSRFQGLDLDGLQCEAIDNELIDVRDDLSLMYEVTETIIGLWLEYRESAFSDDEASRMVRHMEAIVNAIHADPDVRIDDIQLLDEQERKRLLALGVGPSVPVSHQTYMDLFGEVVQQHGDQTALFWGEQKVSYRELDHLTHAFAQQLPSNEVVAIWLDRSPEQIVAMLASWRAGAAYLPLDPSMPAARVTQILQDSGAKALVGRADLVEQLEADWQALAVPLELDALVRAPAEQILPPLVAAQSAYLIYTSGSTGRPKGVRVSHGAVMARMAWMLQTFPLAAGARVLANTSYAFDVSVAEMYWPLAQGAGLVLADARAARDPRYLRGLIREHGISAMCYVPSALSSLLSVGEPSDLASLDFVLAAGEALPASLVNSFYAQTRAELYNVYGPTEATIYASFKKVSALDEQITIGTPLGNTQLLVLNESARLQPLGVEGELCIGGAGLADGYEGQPQLTAEKFIDNPYGDGLLYRTGDRARMLDNGEVEYLGRADQQVKLRGFRVELEDIAHTLTTLDGIEDAAAVLSGEGARAQVIAFVNGENVRSDRLRAELSELLPPYMIPNQFVEIDAVPRLASGKLNRQGLPMPDQRPLQQDIQPPTSEQEKALAAVWSRVLDIPLAEIGVNSNFFELGGDSLLLIALACGAEEEGIFIEVHDLFEHPTIAGSLTKAQTESSVSFDQAPVVGEFPALPRHRKLFKDGFVRPQHWNRCILVTFARHLDHQALIQSFHAVVEHHDGLRLSFHEREDGELYFVNHAADQVDVQVDFLDVTGLAEEQREQTVYVKLNEVNGSFDLTAPPLMKVVVIEDAASSTLALVSHHLLIDMRSAHILLEDLLSSYQSAVSNRPIRLPRKTTSLGEWAQRLRAEVKPDWHLEELAYWQRQLKHAPDRLPVDHEALGESTEADQHTLYVRLSQHETQALTRRVSTAKDAGVHEILLASFAQAFYDWSQLPALVFNTTGVGRDRFFDDVNLLRTVGELNTVYPIELPLQPGDLLDSVQQQLAQVPANGIRYGMLRYLGNHDELAQAQEPQVFFNYVSRLDSALEKSMGASISMAPAAVHTSAPENRICYLLYLEALIQDGELELHLGYDARRFESATAQNLLDGWLVHLRAHLADGFVKQAASAAG